MEAKLWKRSDRGVVCQLCWRFCKLREGETGFCNARVNRGGKLHTLTYGNLSAVESRPVEIKPFFHFMPGTTSITFSTYSCNLTCPWCQNWYISKMPPPENREVVTPEKIVEIAIRNGDVSTCASFNEPILLFEYLLDVFSLAKKRGLKNTMVSNGYMTPMALKMLRDAGLDAINIDIKGGEEVYERYCNGKARFVWKIVEKALKIGLHVEIVNLLITDVNDNPEAIKEVIENHLKHAGTDVPIHFTRYHPAFMFEKPTTPIEKLEMAVEYAKKEGVRYAYMGNVPGHKYENTYCPRCGELLIRRYSYRILYNKIKNGKCYSCGFEIFGIL
jgi:pyruvate formate lyase activating enzyme